MENKYCLYFHINSVKNEIFYVGIGTTKRPYQKHRRNKFWHNIVKKYNYVVDVVEENLTKDEAIEREKFYINKIGRRDLNKGSLVNMTDGGEGTFGLVPYMKGKKHTDKTKQKMSISRKDRVITQETKDKISASHKGIRKGVSPANKGVKMSDEQKEKIRKSHIARKN
jgi:NUMOD3 motif-containing protein